MINDIQIVKEQIIFGKYHDIHFTTNFINNEIPILNYYKIYISELKEKIKFQKSDITLVNKIKNF